MKKLLIAVLSATVYFSLMGSAIAKDCGCKDKKEHKSCHCEKCGCDHKDHKDKKAEKAEEKKAN